ncbi:MAG: hypothetical protein GF418_15590 [Chitinivibrionales bacterium]|nr:hypothetical protein [Chitinivibrionales bacterium]MBD3397044.1 hypothetical protein [Chitinivibrionales bacterium]
MERTGQATPPGERMGPAVAECPAGVQNIFSVPVENAVGTNSLNNAISLIRFEGDRVSVGEVRRDYMKYVSGSDYWFVDGFGDARIGYTQRRGFVMFNMESGAFETYTVCASPHELTFKAAVLDGAGITLVFDISSADVNDYNWVLRTARLRGGTVDLLGEKALGKKRHFENGPWTVGGGNVFAYDKTRKDLVCMDEGLRIADHPLPALYRAKAESLGEIREIAIHRSLPLAVLVTAGGEDGSGPWLARWAHPDTAKRLVPLFPAEDDVPGSGRIEKASGFQFSPDGAWMVLRNEGQGREGPVFIAVPVKESNDDLLGRAIVLGRGAIAGQSPAATAWTRAPQSFVSCDGHGLFRWVLNEE